METIFDITEEMSAFEKGENLVRAEAKESNVLILRKLDAPQKAPDKTICHYELEYRWLSRPIETEQDVKQQNWACVQGNDFILVEKKEVKDYEDKSLFDLFNLW